MRTLEVSGSPYQRGLQHGKTFAKDIRDFAASRKILLRGYLPGWSDQDINELAQEQIDVLQEYREEFEEFCGIADGADLPQEDLMILNNYTDMRNFTKKDEGCSTLYYKKHGQVVYGQTWDMSPEARPYILHLKVKDASDYHIFTVVGCLALCGVASHGIGVFMNDLKTTETGRGLMWPALIRCLLKQRSAEDGNRFIKINLPASAHHYLICDINQCFSVETTGQRTDVVSAVDGNGVAFHTNHYVGKLGEKAVDVQLGSTTYQRYDKLKEFFQENDKLNFQAIAKGLFGSPVASGGVCIYPTTPGAAITCGGLLFDGIKKSGEVFEADYNEKSNTKFGF